MERKVVVEAIKKIILDIKEKCIIKNTAIRDSIFGILENECTVIYYPLENEKNRGFHIKKIVKNELKDFVYINTAKPIAEQIFAAAHEFGHIWEVADKVWKILGYEGKPTEEEEEDITDWFAAELLMPEEILSEDVHILTKGKNNIDEIKCCIWKQTAGVYRSRTAGRSNFLRMDAGDRRWKCDCKYFVW